MELPFAPACERNQEPIRQALSRVFPRPAHILELASGTGQHGVYFARHLDHLTWQCTDLQSVLPGLGARIKQAGLPNLPPPLTLDVSRPDWPQTSPELTADGIFACNILHIASWQAAVTLFAGCASLLDAGSTLALYGPFNENGFTSEGNASLDAWARESFPGGGLRELADVARLATDSGFSEPEVARMPANNLLLMLARAA
ncbi:MAG: DUF938 domain-containing protein [Pseudomonadota bacterium]